MKVKRVKVEIVPPVRPKETGAGDFIVRFLNRLRLGVAIALDLIDLVLGNFPILNTLWDAVIFFVLLIILRNKFLAFFSLTEVFIPWVPPLGQIDALIPMATMLTLADIGMSSIQKKVMRH